MAIAELAFNRFYTYQEMTDALRGLAEAAPARARLH